MQNLRERVGFYSDYWRYWFCILVLLLNLFRCLVIAVALRFTLPSFWKRPLDKLFGYLDLRGYMLIISFPFMLQNLLFQLVCAWKPLISSNKYISEIISPFLITISTPFCNEVGLFLSKASHIMLMSIICHFSVYSLYLLWWQIMLFIIIY